MCVIQLLRRMGIFVFFLLSISILNQGVLCTILTDCVCEADKSFVLRTIDDATVDKITNQLDKINARNEIQNYRLEILGERFEEHERLLKNLNQKALQGDERTGEKSGEKCEKEKLLLDTRTQPFEVHLQQGSFTCPKREDHVRNCAEASTRKQQSGLLSIKIESYSHKPFLVYCEMETQDGGWTVIQRRMDGSIDFFRDWSSYKTGFGNLNGEFFIGLDKLHALTTDISQELLILMTDFDNVTKYAKYDAFAIGNEDEMYALKALGAYSGDAGDSLSHHAGFKFSTKDKKNDEHSGNCAVQFKGAWWYNKCHVSNLNGLYLKGSYPQSQFAQGIVWHTWHGYNYALKTVKILIRPRSA